MLSADHLVTLTKVHSVREIDRATKLLGLAQSDWQIGHFDEAITDTDMPEAIGDLGYFEAFSQTHSRDALEPHGESDNGLVERTHQPEVLDNYRRYPLGSSSQKDGRARYPRNSVFLKAL